ncbi:MAG: hypothetical protein Q7U26_17090 [Aquabacterium sp.]|nr:hypothetical protein [Aquabacterium sp.]
MSIPPRARSDVPALPSGTQPIAQALRGNDALAALTLRVRESQARLLALQPLLPLAMRPQVLAGPIDGEGYTLLAGNQAVAAKLRYLLPSLEQSLTRQGYAALPIRVKVLSAR